MDGYAARIGTLRDMIKASHAILVLGGAGLSTESGIPDFRSEDSIENAIETYGAPPEELLSAQFFYRDPETFYRYYRENLMRDAEPNPAHFALAKLERAEKILSVVTQNVDSLHQKAGSRRVLQLHGSAEEYRCTDCGRFFQRAYIAGTSGVPHCPDCGAIIKPEITLYDEFLNEFVLRAARARMFSADLLIIAGTSLNVYPAADLPQYFMGKRFVVINQTETPADGRANLIFREKAGRVLSDAVEGFK